MAEQEQLELKPDTAQAETPIADDLDVKSHRQSIEDGLRAQFEAAETADDGDKEKPKEKPDAAGDKPRADDGTFTKAKGAKEPAAEADTSSKTAKTDEPKVEPQITAAPTAAPPNSWSKEAKAQWQTLPASIQAEVHKRESDMARGVEQIKQRYSDIDAVMAPRQSLLQQTGRTAGQVIGQLLQWHDALSHADPSYRYNSFLQLARDCGININQTPQAQFAGASQQYPQQPDLTQQLAPFLAPVMTQVDTLSKAYEQMQNERLQNDIASFSQSKDANGNTLHPHFDMARDYMAKVLSNGMAIDLETAYQMAMRNDDGLIAAVRADQEAKAAELKAKAEADKQKAEAERKRKLSEQTGRARRAAISPRVTAPGAATGATQRKGKNVEESLREAFENADTARV